ncbi:MAG: hypothetical protein K0V04_20745 [Deltaproteobacteria bacterium]|nr:hypothetical protein [Deltaproteobacteria bacterium]
MATGRVGATLLAAAALIASTGCAKRLALVPSELEKVQVEAGVQPLRVYPSRRMVTIWKEAAVDKDFGVDRKIIESSANQQLKTVTAKGTSGQILKIEERNGMPLLWVTFDGSCNEPDCAFGFVLTEDERYRLIERPKISGYDDPRSYHHCLAKGRIMKLGKMKSLGEANDVYVNKRKNGKLRTIHLDVIKVVDERTRTRTRRSGGVD